MKVSYVKDSIKESIAVKENILNSPKILHQLCDLAKKMENCILNGKKIILAGNGGSAADSQHIAAEFISKFEFDRTPLAALALTTDTSALTAIGNDYGYENLFSRQLIALGNEGDIFIGITTSGVSPNIMKCASICAEKKVHSVLMTSIQANSVLGWNEVVKVPSSNTARIQESHILIGHLLCGLVERAIFKNE